MTAFIRFKQTIFASRIALQGLIQVQRKDTKELGALMELMKC